MKKFIDINADVGEGFENELGIIPYVSSINIACAGHAGDESTIESVLKLAKRYGVRVGAHPGFEDRINFGRFPLNISFIQLRESLTKQINLIKFMAHQNEVVLSYIKPHGALYHLACANEQYAFLLTEFAQNGIGLMGLPNSTLESICKEKDIEFISEGFADRVYEIDGSLRKRSLDGSIHLLFQNVMDQVIQLCDNKVSVFSNEIINLEVDSICFHGDHKHAVKLIQKVTAELKNKGIEIRG